ncbi:hypothetical protein [Sphingomicrobium flavum]|uniref:hypothetical protein n=1 Tax=Sphingomicrobium flavum TaxID=1229164 RepID=UPI0021ADBED2|nr:hypothetical protein [Sphingomicrobium flavum]
MFESTSIGFRRLEPTHPDRIRTAFWLDDNEVAAVQINEPAAPGAENSLSALALDDDGNGFIVRQGVLHENPQSSRIEADDFQERTGRLPAKILVGGKAAKRKWFIVCPIDGVSKDEVVASVASFVIDCWFARTWHSGSRAIQDRVEQLFGSAETGGAYNFHGHASLITAHRWQGEVWQALAEQLQRSKIKLQKSRHARGYEVDGEIDTNGAKVLIEIKTGRTANDFYCGVGQLFLYPVILPQLHDYDKILLLPRGQGTSVLESSLAPLGIGIGHFEIAGDLDNFEIRFSADFLKRCGMSAKIMRSVNAF